MSYKLSPSRMNLFMECERCFWLRVNKKVKRPTGPFPSLPSGIDKAVKNHFDSFRVNGEKPPELQDKDLELYSDRGFLEKARNWRSEPKMVDKDGNVLRGGVDDLLLDGEKIVVLDYKTRGYPPKEETGAPDYYERQINLYNLILRENGYKTADYGLILYFYPDEFREDGTFAFHTEFRKIDVNVENARKMFDSAIETLEGEKPEHSTNCDYCDWNAVEH